MRQFTRAAAAAFAVIICTFSATALADDWVATKLRGSVLQLIDGDWVKLKRGDTVPDDRVIRTMRSGNVQFRRAAETIDLGPGTQVQIIDRSGRRYTVVKQYFGTVAIEAEVRNVKHFEVQTPHLAAVVKGTKFVVRSGKDGAAVKVTRGHVAVEDNDTRQSVTVAAGQSVTAEDGQSLEVAGRGNLPVVHNADGTPVISVELADDDSGKSNGKKDKSGDGVSVGASGSGVSVNASVGGLNASVEVGNNGNSGNGNSGSGNSGSGGGNSSSGGGNGNGNSGNGNSGNGNGGGGGNNGNGNGNGGGVVSGVVGLVGGLL